jgi:RNA polymerase sigma factor for flagellar operon FliA
MRRDHVELLSFPSSKCTFLICEHRLHQREMKMGAREELWQRYIETRDPALREEIILQNIPLVRHILKRLAIPTLSDELYQDLEGQGIVGLIDAVDRFEPRRGWRFSTYASLRIRGHILDTLRDMDILPRAARKRVKAIERAVSSLRMDLRREPNEREVAQAVDLDVKSYRSALVEANCAVLSMDAAFENERSENPLSLRDLLFDENALGPEEVLEESELMQRVTVAVESLPKRLQLLLSLYYYEELTMKEIGEVLELSESRVSQLHTRAMKQLRSALESIDPMPTPAPALSFSRPVSAPVFALG